MNRRQYLAAGSVGLPLVLSAGCLDRPAPDGLEISNPQLEFTSERTTVWMDLYNPLDSTQSGRSSAVLYADDDTRLTPETDNALPSTAVAPFSIEPDETIRHSLYWNHLPYGNEATRVRLDLQSEWQLIRTRKAEIWIDLE